MKREPSSPREDADDDDVVKLHREAGERLDERPDPSVRARVLEAARQAEELQRARARASSRKPWSTWPRSALGIVLVAVLAGLVVTQSLDGGRDLVTEPMRSAAPVENRQLASADVAHPAPSAPSAPAAERRFERRPFTRDRSASSSRSQDTRERESRQEPAAPADTTAAPVAEASDGMVATTPQSAPAPASDEARSATGAAASGLAAPRALAKTASGFVATSAEAWVAEIARLRRAGDGAGADAELARLRQRYPDFVVPREALPAR